jgi:hypothetical protein
MQGGGGAAESGDEIVCVDLGLTPSDVARRTKILMPTIVLTLRRLGRRWKSARNCWHRFLRHLRSRASGKIDACGARRDIVSRLDGSIIDAYLKHRKTALQFDSAPLGTFLLRRPHRFRGRNRIWAVRSFGRAMESVVLDNDMASDLVPVSPAWPTKLS